MAVMMQKPYLCAYRCQSCGEMNVEVGMIQTEGATKKQAEEFMCRRFQDLKSNVELRREYTMPGIKGICQKCGKRQIWCNDVKTSSVGDRMMIALVVVALVIGITGVYIHQNLLSVISMGALWGITIGIVTKALSISKEGNWFIICRRVDEELSGITQWDPYPHVLEPSQVKH